MTTFNFHKEPLQDSWLDAYGHLNEAYYLVPLSNTTWKFQDYFGIGVDYFEDTGCAFYTVETHLRYLSEVRSPAVIDIETIILGSDPKKIWFAHKMLVEDPDLRAARVARSQAGGQTRANGLALLGVSAPESM